jgi:integrase
MLIVALCAWGLRSGEVASLHSNQLVLDDDKPRIEFEERKNGPSTVALVYGTDLARDRVAATGDGYLFPSRRSKTGHIHRTTVADRFHALADRAGLPDIIDGEPRKPHMARRWWYDRYSATIEDLLEHLEAIAADQGSASARVVKDDYLSAERRRELRREFMHERLTGVFDID